MQEMNCTENIGFKWTVLIRFVNKNRCRNIYEYLHQMRNSMKKHIKSNAHDVNLHELFQNAYTVSDTLGGHTSRNAVKPELLPCAIFQGMADKQLIGINVDLFSIH